MREFQEIILSAIEEQGGELLRPQHNDFSGATAQWHGVELKIRFFNSGCWFYFTDCGSVLHRIDETDFSQDILDPNWSSATLAQTLDTLLEQRND